MKRTSLTALVGAVVLGAAVAPAMGASVVNATAAQKSAITAAIHSTSVAGLNQVPQANYTVGKTVVYAGSKYWARASINATAASRTTFQSSIAVLARAAGTNTWTVLDIGTSEVGCAVAPVGVMTAFGQASTRPCGIGNGYAAAPASLANPATTGWQLINRFFTDLQPANQSKLAAFLSNSWMIKRSNLTSSNKTQYLPSHPTYDNAGILVNEAVYANGQLSVNATNWQTTVPNVYTPSLYTFAWVNGGWQMTSFAKFADVPALP